MKGAPYFFKKKIKSFTLLDNSIPLEWGTQLMAGLLNFWQEFDLDELLTHEVTLQDIEKAFELLKQPDCVKVLIKIWLIKLLIKPGHVYVWVKKKLIKQHLK
jgi:hypothetical protein